MREVLERLSEGPPDKWPLWVRILHLGAWGVLGGTSYYVFFKSLDWL